jgi:hypothetical protein
VAPKVFPTAISLYESWLANFRLALESAIATKQKNLPHASKQLNQTTITKSEGNNNVRVSDVTRLHVDSTQDESGEGESGQAQGSRVGEFASLDRLV